MYLKDAPQASFTYIPNFPIGYPDDLHATTITGLMIPTKLLYLGAAGEHHVMSECFRHQREAFKLPVDRGFDLVVTDAHRHLAKAEIGASNTYPPSPDGPPLYLQVKSRQAHPVAPAAEAGDDRPRWEGSFTIKASDLRLICETPNAFLVCVLFIDISDQLSKARTAYAWWMSSAKVKQLRDSKHFIKSKSSGEELELHACYVEPAPNAPYVQNSYIALFKQHQGKDAVPGQLSSSERIPKDCFDFRKLSAS